jgi:hypothetical protein
MEINLSHRGILLTRHSLTPQVPELVVYIAHFRKVNPRHEKRPLVRRALLFM